LSSFENTKEHKSLSEPVNKMPHIAVSQKYDRSFLARDKICRALYVISPVRPSVCPSVTRVDQS